MQLIGLPCRPSFYAWGDSTRSGSIIPSYIHDFFIDKDKGGHRSRKTAQKERRNEKILDGFPGNSFCGNSASIRLPGFC